MIKVLDTLDQSGGVINLTGATADYLLLPGQTAKVVYTASASVPLRVQTVEGLYEIIQHATEYVTNPTNGDIVLQMNNTTLSNGFNRHLIYGHSSTTTTTGENVPNTSAIWVGYGQLLHSNLNISTYTTNKSMTGITTRKHNDGVKYIEMIHNLGNDTSTAWTSLGTLVFPAAQTGVVTIRRIT